MDFDKKTSSLLLLSIFLFALLIRLPYRYVLLEADEGEIAYISQQMEQGDIPYKDAVHQKMPGMFYIYLLIFKILGKNVGDIRIFTFLYSLSGIFLLYKLGTLLFGRPVGLISSFIFSIISLDPNRLGFMAKAENFMLMPIIASIVILLLAIKKKNNFLFFVCGALNGIAFILKQSAIFNCAFIIGFLFFEFFKNQDKGKYIELIKRYSYFFSGFIITLLPFFIYFWIKGAWNDFIYCTFLTNFDYINSSNPFLTVTNKYVWFNFLQRLNRMLNTNLIFWALCLYAWIKFLKIKDIKGFLIIIWFIFLFLSVFSGLRFFPQYFILTTPALAIASGYGLWSIFEKIRNIRNIFLKRVIGIFIILVVTIASLVPNFKYWFVYSATEISNQVYEDYYPLQVRIKYIASYINQNTAIDDTVFIFGTGTDILFYANRRSATKYIIFYTLAESHKDILIRQKEIVNEIIKNKPKYIIDMTSDKRIFNEQYIVRKIGEIVINDYYPESFVSFENKETECIIKINQDKLSPQLLFEKIIIYRRKEI